MKLPENKWTYLCAIVCGLAFAAKVVGLIDEKTFEIVLGFFGPAGAIAARYGISKVGAKVDTLNAKLDAVK